METFLSLCPLFFPSTRTKLLKALKGHKIQDLSEGHLEDIGNRIGLGGADRRWLGRLVRSGQTLLARMSLDYLVTLSNGTPLSASFSPNNI